MNECYYDKCIYHDKNEPFCIRQMCLATTKNLLKWSKERNKELNNENVTKISS